jgi:hypothetical protein
MTAPRREDKVEIELSADQALVLLEWVNREDDDRDALTFEHESEQRVVWDIEAQLERTLVEPFKPNYHELVSDARQRIIKDRERAFLLKKDFKIHLTPDEALVFIAWVVRGEETHSIRFVHEAERLVLLFVGDSLKRGSPGQPFDSKDAELLSRARSRVIEGG